MPHPKAPTAHSSKNLQFARIFRAVMTELGGTSFTQLIKMKEQPKSKRKKNDKRAVELREV